MPLQSIRVANYEKFMAKLCKIWVSWQHYHLCTIVHNNGKSTTLGSDLFFCQYPFVIHAFMRLLCTSGDSRIDTFFVASTPFFLAEIKRLHKNMKRLFEQSRKKGVGSGQKRTKMSKRRIVL